MLRKPVVAGIYYQGNLLALRNQIKSLFKHSEGPGIEPSLSDKKLKKSYGMILPHAGYMASGPVAAWGMVEAAKMGRPDTIVLLGPSHTGLGMPVSVWDDGEWETPFGSVAIDKELAHRFLKEYDYAEVNYEAHRDEHSIEIHLPLLQYVFGRDIKILPIAMMDQRKKTAMEIGSVIRKLKEEKNILFIASTDLNHYEPEAETREKDEEVISHILDQNIERMYGSISEMDISMCGFGPVAAVLEGKLGQPEMLKHSTSGVITGDYSHVVGYVSMIVK